MGSRLTRHLIFGPGPLEAHSADTFAAAMAAPALSSDDLSVDFLAAPREHSIYLLHVGAEIEHALMIQYLFAAYSLGGPQIKDPGHLERALRWRQTIANIAQQEMG